MEHFQARILSEHELEGASHLQIAMYVANQKLYRRQKENIKLDKTGTIEITSFNKNISERRIIILVQEDAVVVPETQPATSRSRARIARLHPHLVLQMGQRPVAWIQRGRQEEQNTWPHVEDSRDRPVCERLIKQLSVLS